MARCEGHGPGAAVGYFDVAGFAECVEEVAGGVDVEAGGGEVFVLGPDGQAERECEGDGRPAVGVARGDALFGVLASPVVVGVGSPFDRHDLQRGEQKGRVQAPFGGQAWDVAGDLDGDGFGGDAARRVRRRDDEACAAADER